MLPVNIALIMIWIFVYLGREMGCSFFWFRIKWVTLINTKKPMAPNVKFVNFQMAKGEANRSQIRVVTVNVAAICMALEVKCFDKNKEE